MFSPSGFAEIPLRSKVAKWHPGPVFVHHKQQCSQWQANFEQRLMQAPPGTMKLEETMSDKLRKHCNRFVEEVATLRDRESTGI